MQSVEQLRNHTESYIKLTQQSNAQKKHTEATHRSNTRTNTQKQHTEATVTQTLININEINQIKTMEITQKDKCNQSKQWTPPTKKIQQTDDARQQTDGADTTNRRSRDNKWTEQRQLTDGAETTNRDNQRVG